MATLPARWWLILYAVAFMFQPIFLLRKHLEAALVRSNPSLPTMLLAQVDNGWWEELAKLLALSSSSGWRAIASSRFCKNYPRRWPRLLGGLAYGVGEAVVFGSLVHRANSGLAV